MRKKLAAIGLLFSLMLITRTNPLLNISNTAYKKRIQKPSLYLMTYIGRNKWIEPGTRLNNIQKYE